MDFYPTKPQFDAPINRGHPRLLNCCFLAALNEGNGLGSDGITRRRATTLASGGIWEVGPYGRELRFNATASNRMTWGVYQPYTGGDCTVLSLANPISESTRRTFISQRVSSFGTPVQAMTMIANCDNSLLLARAGGFAFGGQESNVLFDVAQSDSTTLVDGAYHWFGGRRAASSIALFYDGLLTASTQIGTGSGSWQLTGQGLSIGVSDGAGGTAINPFNKSIVCAAIWNRALDDKEIYSFCSRPWQTIFQAPTDIEEQFGFSLGVPFLPTMYRRQNRLLRM